MKSNEFQKLSERGIGVLNGSNSSETEDYEATEVFNKASARGPRGRD